MTGSELKSGPPYDFPTNLSEFISRFVNLGIVPAVDFSSESAKSDAPLLRGWRQAVKIFDAANLIAALRK